jgi:NitT/TauT family transport system substrate-binding protein
VDSPKYLNDQRGNEKMKSILLSAVFALALTVISFNANAEVVNIGISTVGLYELPTEISKRKGFYQEEGLDVRKVVVRTPLHVAALLAGELDYSTVTGIILSASLQGMPLKTVMGWFDKPLHMLIARPNIKKLTDLKDKRVAVSTFGSIPHVMLREALASAGMNPEKISPCLPSAARETDWRRWRPVLSMRRRWMSLTFRGPKSSALPICFISATP